MADGVPGYEKYFDMPFGGTSEEPHIRKGPACVVVGLVHLICKLLFRFQITGRENLYDIADKTGVVVIGNHTSYLDVVFMYLSIWRPLWPRMIAKSTLFEGKPYILGWLLARLGVLPIHRDTADKTAIKRAAKCLKNGELICIMPEGTRRGKSDRAPELHAGAALIARMGHAPILPMTVRDAEKIKQKGKMFRFPKVTVEFGQPVQIKDFDYLPKEQRLEACTWYAMRECFAMFNRIAPEDVDMVELFPNAFDFTQTFAEQPPETISAKELGAQLEEAARVKAEKAQAKAAQEQAKDTADWEKDGAVEGADL